MFDFAWVSDPKAWISLATLTALETVLGIDNVIFISILTGKLPPEQQPFARRLGMGLALGSRIGLLFAISWVMGLTKPLFEVDLGEVFSRGFSGRDLILLGGGLFLIAKSTHEIFEKLEVDHSSDSGVKRAPSTLKGILVQIILIDVVFSLDSVITAVGMAKHIPVMVAAMIISSVIMILSANAVGNFVNRHPSMKILALAFLLLIGVMLVAEAMGQHVNKGYIYFAMAFSLVVEMVNMRVRKARDPVSLHNQYTEGADSP